MRYEQVEINGVPHIVKPPQISSARACELWNSGARLTAAVKALASDMTKQEVVHLWVTFHDRFGYSRKHKIPTWVYKQKFVPVSECSEDWLAHHGLAEGCAAQLLLYTLYNRYTKGDRNDS